MRRSAWIAGALVLLVALGLVAALAWGNSSQPTKLASPVVLPGVVSHNATGLLAIPASFAHFNSSRVPVGTNGHEPTLGIHAGGSWFVTGGNADVWRSQDGGISWEEVGKRPNPRNDQDPYLWLDPATNRLFSVPNQGTCSDIRWSDDEGETWQPAPLVPVLVQGGCGNRGHDHQSLVAGPPPASGPRPQGYPNLVYYAFNSPTSASSNLATSGTWMTRSLDGGSTWEQQSVKVFPSDCQLGLNGVPAVAPDGTIYVPKPGCNGLRIGISIDAGQTWTHADLTSQGMGGGTHDGAGQRTYSPNPAVAVDRAGNAFALWAGSDGLLHLATSTNRGVDWSVPVQVTPPGINVTAFSALVANEAGHVAFAYLGTEANATSWPHREAHYAPTGTSWHLHLAWAFDALAGDPQFVTARLTPDDDPVHRGRIWQAGDGGAQTQGRQLSDFIGMAQSNGIPYVAFADSCSRCSQPAAQAALWVAVPRSVPLL